MKKLMKSKLYIILGLLCLPGCFDGTKNPNGKKQNYAVQAIANSGLLTSIIEAVTPIINDIIKKEIGLDKDFDFAFFVPKKIQRLTLYYFNDVRADETQNVIHAVDVAQKQFGILQTNTIMLTSEVNFFAGPWGENDELVIMINDPNGKLTYLNQELKKAAHQANDEYKQNYNIDLYDSVKSERYSYTPHIGLGRVRTTSIKQHLKDPLLFDQIWATIQQRVIKEVVALVEKSLTEENKKLSFEKVGILDLQKQTYIQEYTV
jgi:hypothetical protein